MYLQCDYETDGDEVVVKDDEGKDGEEKSTGCNRRICGVCVCACVCVCVRACVCVYVTKTIERKHSKCGKLKSTVKIVMA